MTSPERIVDVDVPLRSRMNDARVKEIKIKPAEGRWEKSDYFFCVYLVPVTWMKRRAIREVGSFGLFILLE